MAMFKIIRIALRDGLDQPYDFSVGVTYRSRYYQWLYDRASILGQRIGRLRAAWPRPDLEP